jgi:aspartate racemase
MTAKIGLIGGVGWPATVAYYETICRAVAGPEAIAAPDMSIESLDMSKALEALSKAYDEESWATFDTYFSTALDRLAASGCGVAAIASVTPHVRLSAITRNSPIPVVSVVDATADILALHRPKQAVVLGTRVTMTGTLFDKALESLGIAMIKPDDKDIAALTELLNLYFYSGRGPDGRGALIEYARSIAPNPDDVLFILACTDLTPAFPETIGQALFVSDGIQFLDTTAAHVDAILRARDI